MTTPLNEAAARGRQMIDAYRRLAGCDSYAAAELISDVLAAVQADAGWRLDDALGGVDDEPDLGLTTGAADDVVQAARDAFDSLVADAVEARV